MKPILVLFALLIGATGLRADQVYLLFDEGCGDHIRYERTVGGASRMDYFAYGLTVSDGSQLIFETDAEGATYRHILPPQYLSCSDLSLTAELADRINSGQTHLFVVLPTGDEQYQMQPVVMAAVMQQRGNDIRYRSPFAAFSFTPDDAVIGVNLDNGNQGAHVYFEGKEGEELGGAFLFRQHNPLSAHPIIEYKLIPGLGIVQRRMGGDGKFSEESEISAREVNGTDLITYLREREDGNDTAATNYTEEQRSFRPIYVEAAPPPSISTEAQAKDVPHVIASASPPPATTPVTIHYVAPGETLYAISRRYGVAVDAIKHRNGLVDNTIYVGQQLAVGDDRVEPTVPPPSQEEYAAPVVAVPVPYERETSEPISVTSDKFHIVQPGETFASLALRFGYTTARFREFNGVSDQAVAQIGQRLKTSDCNCPPPPAAAVTNDLPEVEVPRPSTYVAPAPSPAASSEYPEMPQDYTDSYPQPASVAQPAVNVVVPPPARTVPDAGRPSAPPAYGGGIDISGGDAAPATYGTTAPVQTDLRATHQVREGESLYSISRQYSISVEELRRLNDLLPADVIVPFQKLYVN